MEIVLKNIIIDKTFEYTIVDLTNKNVYTKIHGNVYHKIPFEEMESICANFKGTSILKQPTVILVYKQLIHKAKYCLELEKQESITIEI